MPSSPLSTAQAARKALADQLDRIRRDAGLTGLELASLCGWHKSKSSRIARGLTVPSDGDIRAWCTACGVPEQATDLVAASRTAESMYTQWRDLHRDGMERVHQRTLVASRPNVSVGIIPFRARRTVWPLEAFYAFDESLVAVETLTAEINVTTPGEIGTYLRAFHELAKIAVHGAEARSRIAKARSTLR
ncbi:Scr1 family TA system antitoxin-like transcriptional regulator [Kitasatospora sp. NPDC003701]